MSVFPLKNSNINKIEAYTINHVYPIIAFVCTYIDKIYPIEKSQKLNKE